MSRIITVYENFYKPDGSELAIGGVETYLKNLFPIMQELGHEVELHQAGIKPFQREYNGVKIYAHVVDRSKAKTRNRQLLAEAVKGADKENDVLFFGGATNTAPNDFKHSLTVQHGVHFDIPRHQDFSHERNIRRVFPKSLKAYGIIDALDHAKTIVCVDHNFPNWYRTCVAYPDKKFYVVPNFTDIPDVDYVRGKFPGYAFDSYESPGSLDSSGSLESPGSLDSSGSSDDQTVRIISARRWKVHRGAHLFADVSERLLKKYPNVDITVAGTGPDEGYMHDKLDSFPNAHFMVYGSEDSLKIHLDKQIAVVPTLGSEGTSLSLLEAMAAGCAVVATNVGGMTNIIINEYNGLMVSPDTDELEAAVARLIEDRDLRERLAAKAYETVKDSFNLKKWQDSWRRVLMNELPK